MAKSGSGGPGPVGGGDGGDGGGGETGGQTHGVPVSEEVLWKARAQEAEEKVAHLEARVQELESSLEGANEMVRAVERRGQIDRELTAAKAVDLETARMLTEATIGEMDEPDVAMAVRELCQRKPFLFAGRRSGAGSGSAMSPGPQRASGDDDLDAMARRARSSGDRGELLRYLRVRRGS